MHYKETDTHFESSIYVLSGDHAANYGFLSKLEENLYMLKDAFRCAGNPNLDVENIVWEVSCDSVCNVALILPKKKNSIQNSSQLQTWKQWRSKIKNYFNNYIETCVIIFPNSIITYVHVDTLSSTRYFLQNSILCYR